MITWRDHCRLSDRSSNWHRSSSLTLSVLNMSLRTFRVEEECLPLTLSLLPQSGGLLTKSAEIWSSKRASVASVCCVLLLISWHVLMIMYWWSQSAVSAVSSRLLCSVSEQVVERRHEQLQLLEGAAVPADLRRLVLHHVAQVLQVLAARSALLVSAATKTTEFTDGKLQTTKASVQQKSDLTQQTTSRKSSWRELLWNTSGITRDFSRQKHIYKSF